MCKQKVCFGEWLNGTGSLYALDILVRAESGVQLAFLLWWTLKHWLVCHVIVLWYVFLCNNSFAIFMGLSHILVFLYGDFCHRLRDHSRGEFMERRIGLWPYSKPFLYINCSNVSVCRVCHAPECWFSPTGPHEKYNFLKVKLLICNKNPTSIMNFFINMTNRP